MGVDFLEKSAVARELFDLASSEVGYDVAMLCAEGPAPRLDDTRYTQPALVTMSLVADRLLEDAGIAPDAVAGFSLGEYAAHAIAHTVSEEKALELVSIRANLMADAASAVSGGMLALVKASPEDAEELCDRTAGGQVLAVANLNCPGQVVISGETEALSRAAEEWTARGGRAVPLATSGAFHSPLMLDASRLFARSLEGVVFEKPRIPLYCNVDAGPLGSDGPVSADAADKLVRQMYSPVRWEETIVNMVAAGITTFVELGPGGVLSGMVKRIDRKLERVEVGTYEQFEKAVLTLGGELR